MSAPKECRAQTESLETNNSFISSNPADWNDMAVHGKKSGELPYLWLGPAYSHADLSDKENADPNDTCDECKIERRHCSCPPNDEEIYNDVQSLKIELLDIATKRAILELTLLQISIKKYQLRALVNNH